VGGVNILILTVMDCSGAGYALMDAINTHTKHHARLIVDHLTRYRYSCDVVRPGLDKLWQLVEWADVYNFQVRGENMLPEDAPRKPVVKTYHGSEYRQHWHGENAQAKARGWMQTYLTVDLSQFGATWIGRPIPDLSYMYDPDPGFHIVHAGGPGKKHKRIRKGTNLVETIATGFEGATFDIFSEVPNDECLRRKAKASLYIDQVGPYAVGYGTNSLEAWSMGIPVISSAPAPILALMRERFGRLPFCPCHDADSLQRRIIQLRDSPELRAHWAKIGRQHVRRWHSPAIVAKRYVELCRKAIHEFA
jgi:hypothetical protein